MAIFFSFTITNTMLIAISSSFLGRYFSFYYAHIAASSLSNFFTSQNESKSHRFSLICVPYKTFAEKT